MRINMRAALAAGQTSRTSACPAAAARCSAVWPKSSSPPHPAFAASSARTQPILPASAAYSPAQDLLVLRLPVKSATRERWSCRLSAKESRVPLAARVLALRSPCGCHVHRRLALPVLLLHGAPGLEEVQHLPSNSI